MYEIKRYEWPLTEEEQEQVRVINSCCQEAAMHRFKGERPLSSLEVAAFDHFKDEFYRAVERRVGLNVSFRGLYGGLDDRTFGAGTFNVSEDGTKLIAYRLEITKE